MNKLKKLVAAVLLFAMCFSMSAFGNEWTWENLSSIHNKSVLLDPSVDFSEGIATPARRGAILSQGIVRIGSDGKGNIKVTITTLAHEVVDLIHHEALIDQWDEKKQVWVNIESVEFERTKAEDPTLSVLMNSFTMTGYPTNKYYRVRGLHLVEQDDYSEGCASSTQGVYITK